MRARAYLIDMKIYAGKAVYFLGERDGEALEADEMRHLAIQRCLEIGGEAAGRVPGFVEALLPEIPFRDAAAMRHRIVHGYASVNADRVAETCAFTFPHDRRPRDRPRSPASRRKLILPRDFGALPRQFVSARSLAPAC